MGLNQPDSQAESRSEPTNDTAIAAVIGDISDKANSTSKNNAIVDQLDTREILRIIYGKVDAIEDFLIKLSAKMDNLRTDPIAKSPVGFVDLDVLKLFELPTDTEKDLDKIESKLKNEPEFKKKLVRI